MKLVDTLNGEFESRAISEIELIKFLQTNSWRQVDTKGDYELLRFRHSELPRPVGRGLLVI